MSSASKQWNHIREVVFQTTLDTFERRKAGAIELEPVKGANLIAHMKDHSVLLARVKHRGLPNTVPTATDLPSAKTSNTLPTSAMYVV